MALQSNTKSNSKENWAAKIRKVNTHLARWVFAKMSPAQTLRSKKSVNPSVAKWSCPHNPTPWPAASSSFSIRSSSVCNGIAFSPKRLKRKLNKSQMIAICLWFCAPIHVPFLVVRNKIEMLRTDIILQDESDPARVSAWPYECMLHAWSCLLGNQLVAEAGLRVQPFRLQNASISNKTPVMVTQIHQHCKSWPLWWSILIGWSPSVRSMSSNKKIDATKPLKQMKQTNLAHWCTTKSWVCWLAFHVPHFGPTPPSRTSVSKSTKALRANFSSHFANLHSSCSFMSKPCIQPGLFLSP